MAWQQFRMDLDDLDADAVETLLMDFGAASVTYSDAADDPVLEPGVGETPLWGRTRITGLFSAELDLAALAGRLVDGLGVDELPPHSVEALEDRAWEREWMRDLKPLRFGERLWVCPGDAQPGVEDAVVVTLDPGLAFGTGTHPTTALCLEWLEGLSLDGARVLDYGCGSGVLAIAALKLGAATADAIDIDPQALIATQQNAERNAVSVATTSDPATLTGQYDVLIANILAGPLVELANQLSEYVKTDARLALSGVLEKQAASVQKAYAQHVDFDAARSLQQDGQTWVCLSGRRKAS